MDETGFQIGVGKDQLVVTRRSRATYLGIPTNRESATAVEAISATGGYIPAFLILTSKVHMSRWYHLAELVRDTVIGVSDTGYTNDELSYAWLKHFDKWSRKQHTGKYRLLLLDGYGSHHTIEFLEYCDLNNIIVFGLPPHTTHILQPLDVVVFQPLKHYHAKSLDTIVRSGVVNITKLEFLAHIQDIRKKAFKPETIQSAFRKTGIYPFDPAIVLDRIQYRAEDIPRTPEPQSSSPFSTPVTIRKLNRVAGRLQQAADDIGDISFSLNLERFIRGSITQGTELIQTKRDLSNTTLAETNRRLRRAEKNRQLQSGGIITVEEGRNMTDNGWTKKVAAAKKVLQEDIDRRIVRQQRAAKRAGRH